MNNRKKYFAQVQPDGNGHQIVYESDSSRRVHHFPERDTSIEQVPHGAGSYHDPEHHHELLDRVESYVRDQS